MTHTRPESLRGKESKLAREPPSGCPPGCMKGRRPGGRYGANVWLSSSNDARGLEDSALLSSVFLDTSTWTSSRGVLIFFWGGVLTGALCFEFGFRPGERSKSILGKEALHAEITGRSFDVRMSGDAVRIVGANNVLIKTE